MKRLWIALALLCAVFTATLCHSRWLADFTGELAGLLDEAERKAESGDWAGAAALTRQASQKWADQDARLHILLRHADTDEIYTGFQEVQEFLHCQEGGEYSAANARLTAQLELLGESEQLTLNNIL